MVIKRELFWKKAVRRKSLGIQKNIHKKKPAGEKLIKATELC